MKKILAALLIACMVLSMSAVALAAAAYTNWTSTNSLPTASGRYKLTTNVTISGSTNPTVGAFSGSTTEVVLDLNGHTVTFEKGYYYVQNSGSLTIEDSVGTGKMTNTASNTNAYNGVIYVKGTCTIEGGTIENNYYNGNALFISKDSKKASCTVNGGTIVNAYDKSGCAVTVNSNATFTLNGGTVESKAKGTTGVTSAIKSSQNGNEVIINGGTIKTPGTAISSTANTEGAVIVSGGEINAGCYAFQTRVAVVEPAEGKTVKITIDNENGAIFIPYSAPATGIGNQVLGGTFNAPTVSKGDNSDNVEISGGIYTIEVADKYIAEGYECVGNEDPTYQYIVKPQEFKVSFNAGENGTGTMEPVENVPYGEYTLPANGFNAPEGMQFKAWKVNGAEYDPGDPITVTADTEVIAVWKDIPTVFFAANGGDGTMNPVDVTGESYELPANGFTAPAGYQFYAWEVNGAEYAPGASITVTEDITVTAVWKDIPTVFFAANGGEGTMNPVDVTGESYELPANGFFAPEGKQFSAWEVKGGEYAPGDSITVTEDTTVTAVWKPIRVTVTFDAGEGEGKMDEVTLDYGDTYPLPENKFTAPAGKQFSAWEVNDDKLAVGYEIEVVENITVTAVWEPIPVEPEPSPSDDPTTSPEPSDDPTPTPTPTAKITFNLNGGTSDIINKTDYCPIGTRYTLPTEDMITPPQYLLLMGWGINGDEYQEKQPGEEIDIDGDVEIMALWMLDPDAPTYEITFDANGGTSMDVIWVIIQGNDIQLPEEDYITPPAGKKFSAYLINGKEYKALDIVPVPGDMTVKVLWEDIAPAPVVTPAPTAAPAAPKTGDNTNIALWMALMAISAVALVGLRKKSKASK